MRAVLYRQFGSPAEVLEVVEDHPIPSRKPGELLVEVYNTSINPCDCKARAGHMPRFQAVLPKVPGGDVAGVVVDSDEGSRVRVGTRVAFLSDYYTWDKPWGSYAEFITVPEDQVAVLPHSISFESVAGLPLVALTAMQAFDPLDLQPGQRVLIHAGAGGLGSVAIQIAKARGLHVTTTCSTRNVEICKELGADVVIDYTKERFDEVCKDTPFDCVLDTIAGDYEWRSKRVLKRGGTYVTVLANTSVIADVIAVIKGKLAAWLRLGPRYHVVMVRANGQQMRAVVKLVEEGKLKPMIDHVLPLERAREGHEYVERGHSRGKVILTVKKE